MENLKNIAPIEDFNWDAYENGDAVTSVSKEDLEKAYDSTLNKVNDREVVDGTVIAMNKREVVVNIGYKSDGIIPLSEFRYNPDLKVGVRQELYHRFTVGELMKEYPARLSINDSMDVVVATFDKTNAWTLPVVDDDGVFVGFIRKSKVFTNYRQLLADLSDD